MRRLGMLGRAIHLWFFFFFFTVVIVPTYLTDGGDGGILLLIFLFFYFISGRWTYYIKIKNKKIIVWGMLGRRTYTYREFDCVKPTRKSRKHPYFYKMCFKDGKSFIYLEDDELDDYDRSTIWEGFKESYKSEEELKDYSEKITEWLKSIMEEEN